MSLPINKQTIFNQLHTNLEPKVNNILSMNSSPQNKAKLVNKCVTQQRNQIISSVGRLPICDRGTAALIIQYCCTVAFLEYRHRVWPYDYMTFSRRIGELWEAFCKTAWEYPVDSSVERISPPDFAEIRQVLQHRLESNLGNHENSREIIRDIEILFDIIGNINMKEDEVFTKSGVPHVIDFKSGFGSNEKGNTLRLITVGRAYKIWNQNTRLMLLVRQEVNNNYLEVLRKTGVWEVYTGLDSYRMIDEMTGSSIYNVRNSIIDWRADLSQGFIRDLESQPGNLTSYLSW